MSAADKIAASFLRAHPAVAARILETIDSAQAADVLERAPSAEAAAVLYRMLPEQSARCAEQLSVETIARLLEELPGLASAGLLRHLRPEVRDRVLANVSAARAAILRMLLQYPESAIGAWMNPVVLTFSPDYTLEQARAQLERAEHEHPRIYVLGRDRKLCGAVRRIALRLGAQDEPVESVLEPVEPLWARESIAAAQTHELWEHEIEAPVVNRQNEFVDSIGYADLRRAYRRLFERLRQGGSADVGELAELVSNGVRSTWAGLAEFLSVPGEGAQSARDEHDG